MKSTLKYITLKVVYNWYDWTKHSVAKRLSDFSPSSLFTRYSKIERSAGLCRVK